MSLHLLFRFVDLKIATANADSPTAAPTKFAYYVPPPPTDTPTVAPTLTRLPTKLPTRTVTATRKPAITPTAIGTPKATALASMNIVSATATSSIVPVASGENYSLLSVLSPPTDRPAARQADLNISLRGYVPTTATLSLIDYTGDTDYGAPQLTGLFADNRVPAWTTGFRVYDWNWSCNCRGDVISDPDVTLLGLATGLGESIRVPSSGSQIGNGFQVLVLYADSDRITLKYTRSDSVSDGYTLHVEGIAIDPNLIALYQQANNAGRGELPALRAGQVFGRAKAAQIRIAIRDTGTFMDPRSRKDWWRGR